MVSFAILRFPTEWDKRLYKSWLAQNGEAMKQTGLWVSDNVEKERRILEIAAGKVKKALCELKERRQDVTTDWRRGQVFVGREMVAKWDDGKMKLLKGEARGLVGRVDALIKLARIEGVEVMCEE